MSSDSANRSAAQVRKKKKRKGKKQAPEKISWQIYLISVVIVLLILAAFGLAGTTFFYQQMQIIVPGVKVGPQLVGNMSIEVAAEKIDAYWNNEPHFLVEDGTHQWNVTLPNIGLWVDPGLTANQAFAVGRDETTWFQDLSKSVFQSYEIYPVVTFNEALARDVFTELSKRVSDPAQNAELIQMENGQWAAIPGKNGMVLDVESAIELIKSDPDAIVQLGYISLSMIPQEAAVTDLSGELERIAAYYQIPLTLEAYDPIDDEILVWDLPQELVSSWIVVDDPYGEPSIKVNETEFLAYLDEWESTLDGKEIETLADLDQLDDAWTNGEHFKLTLRHLPTEVTVKPGQNLISVAFETGIPYWRIQEANPGTSLYGISGGQVLTIPSKNDLLPLPVVENKRIVISISQQHMWLYEDGALLSEHVISTGMASSPTLPGIFQVQTHEINAYGSNWDLWMPHFLGIYEAVPGFMNGIHGLPVLSSGVRLWADVLGSPASYGCIITDLPTGENLFDWAEDGVVVEINA